MIAIYIAIFIAAAYGAKLADGSGSYLGKKQSAALKGIFVMLVFASHSWQYIKDLAPNGVFTNAFFLVKTALGQMIVVPFLFFSGYGVRYSFERKGEAYVRSIPKHRVLKLLTHTTPIILLFLCLQLALGRHYDLGFVLSSLVLWESLGNSNWYIFSILVLYIITYISFGVFKDRRRALVSCLLLTLVYIALMSLVKPTWWYDTVISYVFGMLFYDLSETFSEKLTQSAGAWKRGLLKIAALLLLAAAGYLTCVACLKEFSPRLLPALAGNLAAVAFMLLLLCVSLKVKLGNPVIDWLGDHIFEVYLLQRLPMILFTKLGLANVSLVLWYAACIAVTVLLAYLFRRLFTLSDRLLFGVKKAI